MRGKTIREIIKTLNVPRWRLPWIADLLSALVQCGLTLAIVTSDSEGNARRALGSCTAFIAHFACGASLFG
jgi:phosphoglycolate phosphatase